MFKALRKNPQINSLGRNILKWTGNAQTMENTSGCIRSVMMVF